MNDQHTRLQAIIRVARTEGLTVFAEELTDIVEDIATALERTKQLRKYYMEAVQIVERRFVAYDDGHEKITALLAETLDALQDTSAIVVFIVNGEEVQVGVSDSTPLQEAIDTALIKSENTDYEWEARFKNGRPIDNRSLPAVSYLDGPIYLTLRAGIGG